MTTVIFVLTVAVLTVFLYIFLQKNHKVDILQIERKMAEIIAAERDDTEKMWKALAQQVEYLQSKIDLLQKELDTPKETGKKDGKKKGVSRTDIPEE